MSDVRPVTFYGNDFDGFGMPQPFHMYQVFLVERPAPGVAVAAVIHAVTDGTPLPNPPSIAVKSSLGQPAWMAWSRSTAALAALLEAAWALVVEKTPRP